MSDVLIVKKCQHCGLPMYVRFRGEEEPILIGCEACIIEIKLERLNDNEITIKGERSAKAVRCYDCNKKHLLAGFEEVKDGATYPQKTA